MVGDHRLTQVEIIRSSLSVLIYPLQQLVNIPALIASRMSEKFASREALQAENERLRQLHFLTSAQLQKLTVLEAENRRLRRLLDSAARLPERAIIAELLSVASDPYRHQIVIGKGSRRGVFVGQPILDANGIVGQVLHAGPLSATGLLITDRNHALPVQVDRNGLRGIVVGTGRYRSLELPYLPINADIQEGDLLITSGLGGRFPSGYPVARVVKVERDPARPFARIEAAPTAELDRIREVLLLTAPPAQADVNQDIGAAVSDNAEGVAQSVTGQ
jgi:rod shape-determining protein MreC